MELDQEAFSEYVRTHCFSCWEGCCCGLLKNHSEDHECASETCDDTWTDEQEREWMKSIGALPDG